MNVKEYIESGILEAYVLDALTPEEKVRVAADIAQYPELAGEVKAVEAGLYAFAAEGALSPPDSLKEQIWDAIVAENTTVVIPQKIDRQGNTRPLPPSFSWQRAAVWAALAVSVLTNFLLLSQRNRLRQDQVAMRQEMDTIRQQQQTLALAAANYGREKEMLADTSMQAVVMKTMQPGSSMVATVYWSRNKGFAYLAVQKLPPPPSGKQYQMWVIQDGKPVSMGMIPNEMIEKGSVMELPMLITKGQAFAISLENVGGNPTPTEVKVLGYTS